MAFQSARHRTQSTQPENRPTHQLPAGQAAGRRPPGGAAGRGPSRRRNRIALAPSSNGHAAWRCRRGHRPGIHPSCDDAGRGDRTAARQPPAVARRVPPAIGTIRAPVCHSGAGHQSGPGLGDGVDAAAPVSQPVLIFGVAWKSLQVMSWTWSWLEDAEPQGPPLTCWFDATPSGDPYSVSVQFTGRRQAADGSSTTKDTFEVVHTLPRTSSRASAGSRSRCTCPPGRWFRRAGAHERSVISDHCSGHAPRPPSPRSRPPRSLDRIRRSRPGAWLVVTTGAGGADTWSAVPTYGPHWSSADRGERTRGR